MRFAIILAGLFVGVAYGGVIDKVTSKDTGKICKCGVMASKEPDAKPEMEHELQLDVECNDEGKEKCTHLCKLLAQAAKVDENRQEKFCKAMKKDIHFSPSLFTSVCDSAYTYSGLTFEEPVCCVNGHFVKC